MNHTMIKQLCFGWIIATVVLCGCKTSQNEADQSDRFVAKIRNSDISWDGTPIGLLPKIKGQASLDVLAFGDQATSSLIKALDDPERFAAAHVLLTEIQMNGRMRELSASHWNGLRVELYADGRTVLHPEQRAELKELWVKYLTVR